MTAHGDPRNAAWDAPQRMECEVISPRGNRGRTALEVMCGRAVAQTLRFFSPQRPIPNSIADAGNLSARRERSLGLPVVFGLLSILRCRRKEVQRSEEQDESERG